MIETTTYQKAQTTLEKGTGQNDRFCFTVYDVVLAKANEQSQKKLSPALTSRGG
jgi:hypothetical protein